MGELILHITYGLLIYPVCYVAFRFFNILSLQLCDYALASKIYLPEIVAYVPRAIIPLAWVAFGFSFGPEIASENINSPNDALAFIYSLVWLFGIATLLFKVFVDLGSAEKTWIE